jgi:hypothetical protein
MFYAVEVDVYAPAIASSPATPGFLTLPALTFDDPVMLESYETVYASDQGYRTLPTDTPAVRVYPPVLAEAFAVDRAVDLDPTSRGMSAAWGRIRLANTDGRFDSLIAGRNADGRAVRIYAGDKVFDATRGIYIDPSNAALTTLFSGLAQNWFLSETSLDIPLRDATYWLERPLQTSIYGGTGGYDGSADVAGLPKPKTRGGTTGNPIQNVTPVLIDPTNRIYQYNDAAGTVVAIAEGGDKTNITFQSNVSNLYSGSTNAGQYRTDNSRGLFQLGSTPVRTITADVTGQFPSAGVQTSLADIARYLLEEDCAVPAVNIDTSSFTATAAAYSYLAGFYFNATPTTCLEAVGFVLQSAGWKLIPLRSGALGVWVPQVASGSSPVAVLDTTVAQQCTPVSPPRSVTPPPLRLRVAHARNWTPNLPDISSAITDMNRKSFLGTADRIATALNPDTSYRRPTDPAPIGGGLLVQADAQACADRLMALWGPRRRLYSMPVPVSVGIAREIGHQVTVQWPADDLRNGKPGVIVGEQFRSADENMTLVVLV